MHERACPKTFIEGGVAVVRAVIAGVFEQLDPITTTSNVDPVGMASPHANTTVGLAVGGWLRAASAVPVAPRSEGRNRTNGSSYGTHLH
jgi:hypothetical protein